MSSFHIPFGLTPRTAPASLNRSLVASLVLYLGYWYPHVLGMVTVATVATVLLLLPGLYGDWRSNFSERHGRESPLCPSHKCKLPATADSKMTNKPRRGLLHRSASGKVPLLHPSTSRASFNEKSNVSISHHPHRQSDSICLGEGMAENLNMDHIYLPFWDFALAWYLIIPFAVWNWASGICSLLVRQYLTQRGVLQHPTCNYKRLVGSLCLESMEVVHFTGFKCKDNGEATSIAQFLWEDFRPVEYRDNGTHQLPVQPLSVQIDVIKKEMVNAMLGKRVLTPSEAAILIWFTTTTLSHAKEHAQANWGINVLSPNPVFRWASVVSVMYNYFGYSVFSGDITKKYWWKFGLSKYNHNDCKSTFDHAVSSSVVGHSRIAQLAKHSSIVSFIWKLRNTALNAFADNKQDFIGADGEALFIGTVIHSLDHTLMHKNMPDPLVLDVDHPDFGVMAEMGRFIAAGFVNDLPWLLFERRFRWADHPFYQKIYKQAYKLDPWFADRMDTCMIK